ncbi:hypothetical protein BDN71DRAFT_94730 [Pleurotus eryngii]|uniref:Uncharacterized protein n=1 Tax=Pleurotus eryngii TaxID=5323 RepID=A0A9P5ZPB1_PLEER|nr:hypothetical protein BDN71DRAFT_94730 [Pleurotus eryngii]
MRRPVSTKGCLWIRDFSGWIRMLRSPRGQCVDEDRIPESSAWSSSVTTVDPPTSMARRERSTLSRHDFRVASVLAIHRSLHCFMNLSAPIPRQHMLKVLASNGRRDGMYTRTALLRMRISRLRDITLLGGAAVNHGYLPAHPPAPAAIDLETSYRS